VKVTVWGSRGSIAYAGPQTVRYGGNTACIEVTDGDSVIVLDAGTGLRPLGKALAERAGPVHVLLTHLHMDHIQGLGFFAPLFQEGREVHIWGPPSTTLDLRSRLTRYLSPPLFPVRIVEVDSQVEFYDVGWASWPIGDFEVSARGIVHPGATVGYRISGNGRSMAYLPDHEPALGGMSAGTEWTSGSELARDVDLLVHDGQYGTEEYQAKIGWGHSSVEDAARFADLVGARRLMLFHHDPDHDDEQVDELLDVARSTRHGGEVTAASEGEAVEI
jgi:phosphoribosyl 1,2-cyclic phosphodiesterase